MTATPSYTNRSSEEFAMRAAVEAWGRRLWPDARLVHELVVWNTHRIDMAFIRPETIIGIEIKSSRDTLDRLEPQMACFTECLPQVYLALAPKWNGAEGRSWANTITVDLGRSDPIETPWGLNRPEPTITAQTLRLLWAAELRSVAGRLRIATPARASMHSLMRDIAQLATGREILRGVCRELRARDAFPKAAWHPPSDPPVVDDKF